MRLSTAAVLVVFCALTASCSQTGAAQTADERPTAMADEVRIPDRFEFDAVSTDGSLLYLIERRPPKGSENYRVRVYDFATHELRPEPVADKRNLETDMSGRPEARTTSKDGVWVFTLYRGAEHSFVHALNVDKAYAHCLDLPHGCCGGSGEWSLRLSKDGSTLHAVTGPKADAVEFDLRNELDG